MIRMWLFIVMCSLLLLKILGPKKSVTGMWILDGIGQRLRFKSHAWSINRENILFILDWFISIY